MPEKQSTHKPISVRVDTYDAIQRIAKELSHDKGVPISVPTAIQVLVDAWKGMEINMKPRKG